MPLVYAVLELSVGEPKALELHFGDQVYDFVNCVLPGHLQTYYHVPRKIPLRQFSFELSNLKDTVLYLLCLKNSSDPPSSY